MGQKVLVKDDTDGAIHVSSTNLSELTGTAGPFEYEVGVGGQSVFSVAYDFSDTTKLTVSVNGVLATEGAGDDFTRDSSANSITFSYTVPQGSVVKVEIG